MFLYNRVGISVFVIQASVLNSKPNELKVCVKYFLLLEKKHFFKDYLGR